MTAIYRFDLKLQVFDQVHFLANIMRGFLILKIIFDFIIVFVILEYTFKYSDCIMTNSKPKTIPCKQWINKQSNKKLVKVAGEFAHIASDPNKIKILLLLDQYNKHDSDDIEKLYVSDLADHLSMSVSAISHSLKSLQGRGFVNKKKIGRTVRYSNTEQGNRLITYANHLIN